MVPSQLLDFMLSREGNHEIRSVMPVGEQAHVDRPGTNNCWDMQIMMLFAFTYNIAQRQSRPDPSRKNSINPRPERANRLFLLLRLGTLDLGRAAEGLLSVLALLACLDGLVIGDAGNLP